MPPKVQPVFEWYTIITGANSIEQGDFLDDFPIITPPVSLVSASRASDVQEEASAKFQTFNIVVMTQSCDLVTFRDDSLVILCPRYDFKDAQTSDGKNLANKDGWKKLIAGRFANIHLINKCSLQGFEFDYQVIDLQRIFSVPFSIVREIAVAQHNRLRLNPPYREHLAQAFARQFMRIGLPLDLPRDYPYKSAN